MSTAHSHNRLTHSARLEGDKGPAVMVVGMVDIVPRPLSDTSGLGPSIFAFPCYAHLRVRAVRCSYFVSSQVGSLTEVYKVRILMMNDGDADEYGGRGRESECV